METAENVCRIVILGNTKVGKTAILSRFIHGHCPSRHKATGHEVFKEQVVAAQEFDPVLVNCHAMKDYFTEEMAEEFFNQALPWQDENKYNVMHETHRKRFLHSPWVTRGFVKKFPNLKVTH